MQAEGLAGVLGCGLGSWGVGAQLHWVFQPWVWVSETRNREAPLLGKLRVRGFQSWGALAAPERVGTGPKCDSGAGLLSGALPRAIGISYPAQPLRGA